MSSMRSATLAGLLFATALATPTKITKQCVDLEIPVDVSATNYHFNFPKVNNNIDTADWVWNVTTWDMSNITERITGTINIDDTFTISAQLCVPVGGSKKDILQIATHGVGFDKRYVVDGFRGCEYKQQLTLPLADIGMSASSRANTLMSMQRSKKATLFSHTIGLGRVILKNRMLTKWFKPRCRWRSSGD
jgi:hypothetical protein